MAHGPGRAWIPIVVSAQIINAMQTVVSRQIDITQNPAVVSTGIIKGGVRNNIIPDSVEVIGTIRTFDPKQKQQIYDAMKRLVENTAEASGATATFEFDAYANPVTYNNPELTARVLPSLRKVAGAANVKEIALITGSEDFAYFGEKIPASSSWWASRRRARMFSPRRLTTHRCSISTKRRFRLRRGLSRQSPWTT